MFVLAEDHKKGLAATPIIWTKKKSTETGYYWPRYGLHFKLKNYVPLPIDSQELKREWRWVPCTILLNGKQFKTYADTEKALSILLNNENEGKADQVEPVEVESAVAEQFEKKVGEVNSDVVDEESVDQVLVDMEPVVVESFVKEVDDVNSEVVYETDAEKSEEKSILVDVEPVVAESSEEKVDEVDSDVVEKTDAEESFNAASGEVELVSEESNDESFENFPLKKVVHFMANEEFLKDKNGLQQLKEFYIKINENSERKFVNECVRLSFEDDFLLQYITFKKDKKKRKNGIDCLGVFNETRMYRCLKEALVKKLKLSDLDETELKKILMKNFERIKKAIKAEKV